MKKNKLILISFVFVLCSCFVHKGHDNYEIEDISTKILTSYFNDNIKRVEDEKIYSRYYKIYSKEVIKDSLQLFKDVFFISKVYHEIDKKQVDSILIFKNNIKLKDGSLAYLFEDEIASSSSYMGAYQLFIYKEEYVTQLIFDDFKIDDNILTESSLRDKIIKKKYFFDTKYKLYLNTKK